MRGFLLIPCLSSSGKHWRCSSKDPFNSPSRTVGVSCQITCFKHVQASFSNSSGSLYTRFASACAVEVDLTTNQWFACVHPPTEPTQNLIGWLFEYSAVLSIFHFQDVCGEWRSLLGRFVAGLPWNVQSAVLRILCKFAPANPLWLRSEAPLLDGSASLRWRSLFRAPHVGWPRDTTVWRQKTNIELSSVRNYW